jgi:hypothetical protein
MPVHTPAAYGMYSQETPLNEVVRTLNQAGFGNEDICIMLAPSHPIATIVRDASFLEEREASAVTAGLIGWLSGFGAVVIPTVGFFIRSQEFFQALVVAKDSAMCGNSSTLAGLGFPANDARRYDTELRKLGVMVYVSCPEKTRTTWAIELLRQTGARETAMLECAAAMEAAA